MLKGVSVGFVWMHGLVEIRVLLGTTTVNNNSTQKPAALLPVSQLRHLLFRMWLPS